MNRQAYVKLSSAALTAMVMVNNVGIDVRTHSARLPVLHCQRCSALKLTQLRTTLPTPYFYLAHGGLRSNAISMSVCPSARISQNRMSKYSVIACRPRRRRISSTNCVEFPRRRSRLLTSHSAVEFLLRRRRRILCPIFDTIAKKAGLIKCCLFLRSQQPSTNSKLQQFNLQLFYLAWLTNRTFAPTNCDQI